MIKRAIEISRQPAHLASRRGQIVVQPYDEPKSSARELPAEDLGLVMIDQSRCTVTSGALAALMEHGAAVVVCGRNHLPAGIMLPISKNTETVWRVQDQVNATRPTTKRLWQQLVVAKIRAQARNLPEGSPARRHLEVLAGGVRSGDADNHEAHAAKAYWNAWGPNAASAVCSSATAGAALPARRADGSRAFRRDPDGADLTNGLLNYGYAVLRALVGRALVGAGLFPALGLHHRHRSNAFCLADDLMEPLRPLVDRRVARLLRDGCEDIDQPAKAHLVAVMTESVETDGTRGPLTVALPRVTASLTSCLRRECNKLLVPVALPDPFTD